jgi:hypothetical protein
MQASGTTAGHLAQGLRDVDSLVVERLRSAGIACRPEPVTQLLASSYPMPVEAPVTTANFRPATLFFFPSLSSDCIANVSFLGHTTVLQ